MPKATRRLVLFMTGYDPAGPERYYLMMRQQSRYYQKRFGVPISVQKPEQAKDEFLKFNLIASWPEGECEIDYLVSNWQECVLEKIKQPFLKQTAHYLYWYFAGWSNGVYSKIMQWQKKFLIVYSVPLFFIIMRLLFIALLTGLFSLTSLLLPFNSTFYFLLAGFISGIFLCYYYHSSFAQFFENHLAYSVSFQTKLTFRGDNEQKVYIGKFKQKALKHIHQTKPDEILIIGHSCGFVHSLPLHKALLNQLENDQYQPLIAHMTIGSLLPFTLAHKKEAYYRPLCEDLISNPKCCWIDFFAPHDPFSTPYADIKKDFHLNFKGDTKKRHQLRSAAFSGIFDKKKIKRFRFNPLRMHFQYLAANDKKGRYDFFKFITNPLSLKKDLAIKK